MLNDEDMLRLYIKQNIPLNGRKVVEHIRNSDPVRRVGGGTHNVTTRFASTKMGRVIQAESHKGELPLIYLHEHDPFTHEFYDQPSETKLSYKSSQGKKVTHRSTPDFFTIQEDWMGWEESKPEEKLQESFDSGSERFIPDGNGGWRCPPGEAFAAQFGLSFRVRSQKDINWILVRNLEFLSDYLDPSLPIPTQVVRDAISDQFGGERWLLLRDLLQPENISADAVYSLIAK